MTTNTTTTTTHLLAIPASVKSDDRVAIFMAARRDLHGWWFGSDDTAYIGSTDLTMLMKFVGKAPNMKDIVADLQWFTTDGVDWPNAQPAASPF